MMAVRYHLVDAPIGKENMHDTTTDCTEFFLSNPKAVAKWLTTADKHMQTYAAGPDELLLPKAHKFLTPLIETYARNTEGFIAYITTLRDQFSKEDAAWEQVQTVMRKVNGRFIQQLRRERSSRAIKAAEGLYGETDYHTRLKWVADLEHGWAKRRLAHLDDYRRKSGEQRIDTETRAEILAEFWDVVDTEIYERREIPKWN
jgi:hypothetical protein